MSIGTRLTLYLVAALAVPMLLFVWMDERQSRERLLGELRREGRAAARTLQLSMEDHFADRDLEEARELVDKVTLYERILGIRVFGADGAIMYQSHTLAEYPFLFADALSGVLRSGIPFESERTVGKERAISFILPIRNPEGQAVGAIQLVQLVSYIDEDARATRVSLAILAAAMIAVMATVVFLTGRIAVTRRCEALIRSFRRVAGGHLRDRVPETAQDELGWLACEFNAMCDRLEEVQGELLDEQEERRRTEAALRNAERLAGLGRLAAGLAHEIGTPLNVIRGRTEALLRRGRGQEEERRSLETILAQIDRISRTVRGMLDFARGREARFQHVEVAQLLRRTIEFLEHRFTERDIRLQVEAAADLPPVQLDPDQMEEVFLNLLMNAADSMPTGGTLRVGTKAVIATHPSGNGGPHKCIVVEVEDTGTGIAHENLSRVFDPFFTTKGIGEGTGLGLSIAHGIVARHGGWIEVESEPEQGTIVKVFLRVWRNDSESTVGEPDKS